MTSRINSIWAVLILATILLPQFSHAQERVALSVSPTLFDMSAEPGKVWNSTIRVINTNPFELELEASVVNFTPRDESGAATF
ncbi:hypothetical protein KC945_02910, partial [Candidatus Saccharibacteria bacterium]|nr:hypothetical protein [Candidatus Saccharibacteria bacterium]